MKTNDINKIKLQIIKKEGQFIYETEDRDFIIEFCNLIEDKMKALEAQDYELAAQLRYREWERLLRLHKLQTKELFGSKASSLEDDLITYSINQTA